MQSLKLQFKIQNLLQAFEGISSIRFRRLRASAVCNAPAPRNDQGLSFGFTMMELLVVMGLMATVSVIGLVSVSKIKRNEDIASVVAGIVNILEKGHAKSLTGEEDETWKVVMGIDGVVLQTGGGIGIESYNLPAKYMLVGPAGEIIFRRSDGRVVECEAGCTYEVREVDGELSRQIQVLYSGGIEY